VIRPGLIVGPGDESDRFTYWPVRLDRGGDVAAPGDGSDPVQIIDARDLAEWTVRMVEARTTGTFNAVGPGFPLTMGDMLCGIRAATTAGARLHWLPAAFLAEQKVEAWSDMPVWVPASGEDRGVSAAAATRGPRPQASASGRWRRPRSTPWPGSRSSRPSAARSCARASHPSARPSSSRVAGEAEARIAVEFPSGGGASPPWTVAAGGLRSGPRWISSEGDSGRRVGSPGSSRRPERAASATRPRRPSERGGAFGTAGARPNRSMDVCHASASRRKEEEAPGPQGIVEVQRVVPPLSKPSRKGRTGPSSEASTRKAAARRANLAAWAAPPGAPPTRLSMRSKLVWIQGSSSPKRLSKANDER